MVQENGQAISYVTIFSLAYAYLSLCRMTRTNPLSTAKHTSIPEAF